MNHHGGKVAVLAKIPAQPGKRDELVKALEAAIDNANTEAGTLLYILHTDPKDENTVYFYELYTDQDALDRARDQRPLQGDRRRPARPRRRPPGADDPHAGRRQGTLTDVMAFPGHAGRWGTLPRWRSVART